MAITTTWSIDDMKRKKSDGGVFLVYWSCLAGNVTGTNPDGTSVYNYTAIEGGKLRCEYNASDADFIPYADLTKNKVLGWVWNSLRKGNETADEAKARIETERKAKVQNKIDSASSDALGVPW
tara:strand:- start:46 stop:414 length:369 start_codon:yes stop_codon:yes gene_type:complete